MLTFPLKPDTREWSIGLQVFWLEVAELNVHPADLLISGPRLGAVLHALTPCQ